MAQLKLLPVSEPPFLPTYQVRVALPKVPFTWGDHSSLAPSPKLRL